ncbi:MAG TPA: O-antigen ligase family protein [Rickettsiales bacterium]|nr:O-antigen ligase family protein [Rickettsiales bacterium]
MVNKLLKLPLYLTAFFPILFLTGTASADIGMSLIAICFLLHSWLEKDWAWTKALWVRTLGLLWIYMNIRGLFAEQPSEALHRSLPFVRYFVFAAALAYWTLREKWVHETFLKVLASVVLLSSLDALLQWVHGTDLIGMPYKIDNNHIRLTAPFRMQIVGIMLAWLSLPVCMLFIKNNEGRLKLDWKLLIILPVLVAIVLSGERMALLLTAAGWLMAVFMLPVRKIYPLAAVIAGIAALGALAYMSPVTFNRQIVSTVETLQNWQQSPYGILLTSDLRVAQVNPVFGIGTNHFRLECPKYFSGPLACNLHPHNIYLEWFIEQGFIGFILFLTFIYALLRACVKNWQVVQQNPVCIGFLVAVLLRLWPLASSTGFFSRWGAPPFWLVIGALLVYITGNFKQNTSETSL